MWSLRVDVHVLDHCGNLVDAATLAAQAALTAYRKPQVRACRVAWQEAGVTLAPFDSHCAAEVLRQLWGALCR